MSPKHSRPRNVPHPPAAFDDETSHRDRKRKTTTLGGSVSRAKGRQADPARPVVCLLFDDLAAGEAPPPLFGMYPPALIPKMLPWLGCHRRDVLHVCSGALPRGEGIRVDVRAAAYPDIVADGRCLPFADGSIAGVMLDPPYTKQYATDLYGIDYPKPKHLLAEAARVVRPGGRIAIVHYIMPMPPPACVLVKAFGLSVGLGFPMRAVTIFQREQASLFTDDQGMG